jgi:lysozyme
MSRRIRVDTDLLRKKADEIEGISVACEQTGDKIVGNTSGIKDYGGQLPIRKNGLAAQSQANAIRDQLKEDAERLRFLAAAFDMADRRTADGFSFLPPAPEIFGVVSANLFKHVSQCGYNFLKQHEGVRYRAYDNDGGCNCTIGIGHKLHDGACSPEDKEIVWSQERVEAEFQKDIRTCEEYIKRVVTVPLTQAQFDALVSFVFNLGDLDEDILQALNNGDYRLASQLMGKRHHARNKDGVLVDVPGLQTRRWDEYVLFNFGMYGNEGCDSDAGRHLNEILPSPTEKKK